MKKIYIIIAILLAITLSVYFKKFTSNKHFEKPPVVEKEYTLNDALASITAGECEAHMKYLASDELEGRMSGKKGNVLAAKYIKSELEKYGLKTTTQKFKIKKLNAGPKNESGEDFTENIYAWIDGKELKDEIIVVGAHFDHVGYGPSMSRSKKIAVHNGADDNASGTVAVLEIAQAMSKLKPQRTILFQFYSAEEMGLLGSRYYCENPMFPTESPNIKNHVAMINLDMIGHLNSKENKASFAEAFSSVDIQKQINELNKKYNFAKQITGRGTGGSDHASFYNKKIPVAFIHTGLHKYYHTPEDDIETLNYVGIENISKYALELTWQLSNEAKPQFNEAEFKEMPYHHDHGHNEFPY